MELGENKKAFCRVCLGDRNCEVKGIFQQDGGDDGYQWSKDWFLLQCRGCDAVFCQTVSTDSESYYYFTNEIGEQERGQEENIEYWPAKSQRERPNWISDPESPLRKIEGLWKPLNEVYGALENGLIMTATIGVRTVFDICSEALGIDSALSFKLKLEQLAKQGKIGHVDQENLETLVEAGNASAHRGWLPETQELNTILDILEHFLRLSFIDPDARRRLDEKAQKLKGKVPQRNNLAAQSRS